MKWENCERVVKGMDVVIHLAGITGGGQLHRDHPAEIFYRNMIMGAQLMEAAHLAGIQKFVIAGSVAEYPAAGISPLREEDLWSGFPAADHAPYAVAKRALLVQGQAYREQYHFNAIHLLLTNIYGPAASMDSGVIPSLIKKIRLAKLSAQAKIVMVGDGSATRDFLYVEDAADAIIKATERYDKPNPVNIGSGKEERIADIAKIIAETMEFDGVIEFGDLNGGNASGRFLDVSSAEREFGFRAMVDVRTGLRKTIGWYNDEHV
jgi:GDP-L-fucose synthase